MQQIPEGAIADGPNGPLIRRGGKWVGVTSQPPIEPAFEYEGPQAAANIESTRIGIADTAADNSRADAKLVADLLKEGLRLTGRTDPSTGKPEVEPIPDWKDPADKSKPNPERPDAIKTLLDSINRLRGMADKTLSVGSWSEYWRENPLLGQNRKDIEGALEQVQGDLIQQQIAILAEMNGGKGVATMANSESEAARMAASVANLSPSQSKEEFLVGLERAEQYYLRQAARLEGKDTPDNEVKEKYLPGNYRQGERLRGFSPGPGAQTDFSSDETYSTPEDLAVTRRVQQVYNQGGSAQEMAQVVRDAGREVRLQDMQDWSRAIDYRDARGEYEGMRTGYATVSPPQSGQRSLAGQAYGDFARGPIGGRVVTAGISAGNVPTLGGIDEVTGAINSVKNGTNMADEIAYADLGKQNMQGMYPGTALASELLTGFGIGGLVGKAAPKIATSLAGSMPRAAATSSILGGVSGGLELNDNREFGAGVGFGVGLFGGPLGYKIGTARPTLKIGGPMPKADPQAVQMGRMSEGLDVVDSKMKEAEVLGIPYALADADPSLRTLAGSAVRKSPNARAIAEQVFEPRARGQADRANAAVNDLAPIVDVTERGQQWRQAAQTASEPLYNAGRSRAAPINDRIASSLNTETGKKALQNARDIADADQRDINAMGFDLDGQGNVVIREAPSWETLDYVKRGIDAQLEPFRNPVTGKLDLSGNPQAQALEGFRKRFVATLDELNPDYKAARNSYQEQIRNKDALERGSRMAAPRFDEGDIGRATEGLDETGLGEFRRGYSSGLAGDVDKVRFSGNPYERIYGSPRQQTKVNEVFPGNRFGRVYDLERDMSKTAYETLGGSPTASRMASDAAFDNGTMRFAADMTADLSGGGGAFLTRNLLSRGARSLGDSARLRGGQRKADALAPILMNLDPAANRRAIADASRYLEEESRRKALYGSRGGLFGAALSPSLLSLGPPE